MPQFNTGTSWDQGLNGLGALLFPDPSKIAQAGLMGAQQRNQMLEARMKERQMGGEDDLSSIIRNMPHGQPSIPGQAPGQPQGPMTAPPPGPAPATAAAPPPISGAAPASYVAPQVQNDPEALLAAGGPSAATPPVASNDAAATVIKSFADTSGSGGGKMMATQAGQDGSPAPLPYDIGPAVDALIRRGVDGDKLKSGLAGILEVAVQNGQMSQPRADQIMLAFNPAAQDAMARQKYVTESELVPVWDNQTHRPTEITHGALLADQGRYRAIGTASESAYNAPTRAYDPRNPLAAKTAPMYEVMNQGGVQVTQNAIPEAAGGLLAGGRPATRPQIETISSAQTVSTPPEALDPQKQSQNRQIDDQTLQKAFPPTGNVRDANMPVVLDDPDQVVEKRTDELQRIRPQYRNNRAGAYTEALQELQQQNRIGPINRGTTWAGRNVSSTLTGQVGANPDVVMVTVQTAKGPVKQPRLRVRVLPAGQTGAPAPGQRDASVSAAPPAAAAATQTAAPPAAPQTPGPASEVFAPKKQGAKIGNYNLPDNGLPGYSFFGKPSAKTAPPSAANANIGDVWSGRGGKADTQAPLSQQPKRIFRANVQAQPGPGPQAPAPQAALPAQQAQGTPINAPDGTVFRSRSTGQIMIAHGGVAYPATPEQLAAMQGQQ